MKERVKKRREKEKRKEEREKKREREGEEGEDLITLLSCMKFCHRTI